MYRLFSRLFQDFCRESYSPHFWHHIPVDSSTMMANNFLHSGTVLAWTSFHGMLVCSYGNVVIVLHNWVPLIATFGVRLAHMHQASLTAVGGTLLRRGGLMISTPKRASPLPLLTVGSSRNGPQNLPT